MNNAIWGITRIFAFWLFNVQEIDQSSFFVLVVYFEKMMERLNSGKSKNIFKTILCILNIGLKSGKALWPNEEETGKDSSIVLILQETFFTSKLVLQGHSGRNFCDLSLQDNVLIPDGFFKYILSRRMCNHLHSITNSGLIAGRQNSSRVRQTVFFTAVNPMHKNHKDPKELDLTQATFCIVQVIYTVRWVDIQIVQRKNWSSIKQDRTKLSSTMRSQLIALYLEKQSRWILKKSHTRECICVTSTPPTISFKDNLDVRSGFWIPNKYGRPACGEREEMRKV